MDGSRLLGGKTISSVTLSSSQPSCPSSPPGMWHPQAWGPPDSKLHLGLCWTNQLKIYPDTVNKLDVWVSQTPVNVLNAAGRGDKAPFFSSLETCCQVISQDIPKLHYDKETKCWFPIHLLQVTHDFIDLSYSLSVVSFLFSFPSILFLFSYPF